MVGIQRWCKNETSAVFNAVLYTILPYSNHGIAYCFNSKHLAWKKISLLSRSNAQSSQPWTRQEPKVALGKIFLIIANTRNKLIKISHCLDVQYANTKSTRSISVSEGHPSNHTAHKWIIFIDTESHSRVHCLSQKHSNISDILKEQDL